MPSFRTSLWDDSEPDYAPCIVWTARGRAEWRAQPRYVKAGYTPTRIPLPPGEKDDDLQIQRASLCRQYTREMWRWWAGQNRAPVETVGWLIARYQSDEASEFQGVKANTRENYRWLLERWKITVSHMRIDALTFERLKSYESSMKSAGRSASYIHRMFTMLRSVMKHGKLIRATGAREVAETLSEMKFRLPPKRTVKPTRMQVYRIAAKAWRGGQRAFAVGIMLQFEMTLRAVDIRGQWLADSGLGGIRSGKKIWADGLTWDMVAPDGWSFTKVISKTEKSLPDPITFSLRNLAPLRERMMALADADRRVGPVFLNSDGQPFTQRHWASLWAKYRKAARVPEHVWGMDARAGAISEADSLGASREMLSSAAQHQNLATTARYVRNRSEHSAAIVDLRQRRNKA